MIYLVRMTRELVTHGLEIGYQMKHPIEVIEGLPPGCELIAANIEPNGVLVLSFLKDNGGDKIVDQKIIVQTNDSREEET